MHFVYETSLALIAIAQLVSGSLPVQANILQKRNIVIVTQEVLEIVGYTSTVWVNPPPSSTYEPAPTSIVQESQVQQSTTTTIQEAAIQTTTSTTPIIATSLSTPSTSAQSSTSSSGSSSYSGESTFSGKATYYATGLGSCGLTSSDTDMIAALSKVTMSKTSGANPNLNPMCGQKIIVKSSNNPTGVQLSIVDTCPGCSGPYDLDLSPSAFDLLGSQADGVIDITWDYV